MKEEAILGVRREIKLRAEHERSWMQTGSAYAIERSLISYWNPARGSSAFVYCIDLETSREREKSKWE
jgi:hypothetical protein